MTGVHVPLECDLLEERVRFEDWWGVPVGELAALGRKGHGFWTCNAGLFVVRRDRVRELRERWLEAVADCLERGWAVTEEVPLSLALGGMVRELGRHCVWGRPAYWVSDWAGHWCGRLPEAGTWVAEEFMTGRWRSVRPAIVHAMRSKQALVERGGKAEGL